MISKNKKALFINLITISRIVISFFVFLGLSDQALFAISIWAGLSDFIDGFLARRFRSETKLGMKLDQAADKAFHFFMLLYLSMQHMVSLYFVILFYIREVAIIVLRYRKISSSSSSVYGKLKTFLTYALFIYIFGASVFGFSMYAFNEVVIRLTELVILVIAYWSLLLSIDKPFWKS